MNYFERAKYFRTKKRLGQNFLIDGQAIADIIDFADIQPDDTIIEIGPGVGFVTEQLVKHAKKVIAIELDEEAIKELKKLDAPNLEIIHNDILKQDLSELCEGKVKVVDVRRTEDYEIAHIPGAISIPKDEIENNLDKLSKEEVTVIYCYNRECHLGYAACLKLVEFGYPVMHLDGGFKTWTEDFRFATIN